MASKQPINIKELEKIVTMFDLGGPTVTIAPHKSGHINDTYISHNIVKGDRIRFIHQRINHEVFKDVPKLMDNVVRITKHLAEKIDPSEGEKALQLVPAKDGQFFLQDDDGNFWRTYVYISGTRSVDVCQGVSQAEEAARVFGKFLGHLKDLPGEPLFETIPFFQHTPKRFEALSASVNEDKAKRASTAANEIDFALTQQPIGLTLVNALESGIVPTRAIHNDLKLNNILFDNVSKKGTCVVDLDTCMPGTLLFDFGDLIRNTSIPVAEDEVNLDKVEIDLNLYKAIVDGIKTGAGDFMSQSEWELLPIAPRVLALTLGVRFLTDYLNGDTYFKISYPEHNLVRARTQFKIVRSMEKNESAMKAAI